MRRELLSSTVHRCEMLTFQAPRIVGVLLAIARIEVVFLKSPARFFPFVFIEE